MDKKPIITASDFTEGQVLWLIQNKTLSFHVSQLRHLINTKGCCPVDRELKGLGKRGHIVADTLLLMTFLGRANARDTK